MKEKAKELVGDLINTYREPFITWFIMWPTENPEKLIIVFFFIAIVYSAVKYF
ncbi:MAG: hypothetical protein ABH880_01390 [Patescibacteria group bacterium]